MTRRVRRSGPVSAEAMDFGILASQPSAHTHTIVSPYFVVRELDRNAGNHTGAMPGGSVYQENTREKKKKRMSRILNIAPTRCASLEHYEKYKTKEKKKTGKMSLGA